MTQTIEQLTARVREFESDRDQWMKDCKTCADQMYKHEEQLAASQAYAEEQLAKAEQRVAEACAALVEDGTRISRTSLSSILQDDAVYPDTNALAIRSGEWRKFVKEV